MRDSHATIEDRDQSNDRRSLSASLPVALAPASPDVAALAATDTPSLDDRSDFDQVERWVILLSRNDPWRSLADPHSRTMRLLRCVGVRTPNWLADARLEALRRYAVILRLGGPARDKDLQRLLAAGFVAGQAARLEQMVAPWRRRPRARPGLLRWGALGLAALASYDLLVRVLDDHMIALMLSGMFIVLLAPGFLSTRGSR